MISELTKLRTVRSTPWTLAAFLVVSAGLAYLLELSLRDAEWREGYDPLFATFLPLTIGQMALVVFGALAVTSEYSSGTIRASLAAVPHRGRFYLAKLGAVTTVAAAASALTVPVTFLAGRAALTGEAVRACVGAGIYLTLMCVFAFGLATMVRHTAAALGGLLPVLFLGSQGLGNIPAIRKVTQFLPDQTGWVAMHLAGPQDDPRWARDYGAWTGLGLLALWALAAVLGGYWVLRRRDA
ncbi:ABC transporter permease subunit [Phytohabitans houttuyneae]|uniref:ABC transporter n=1 Tax=Phytohabitans houttuyneae TaxID=1076126 RepID=A0A6V8KS97_9ACTN|nr:ABC transporter permease subunit [Phytohabitans houttuyneae]GFJ86290.1 ABC transporter [Phytohabitans houttuyneae]